MLAELSALGAACSWAASTQLVGHFARRHHLPAPAIATVKCFTGAAIFAVALLVVSGRAWPEASSTAIILLVASGVIGIAATDTSFYAATFDLGVQPALLLLSSAPVFAAVGGVIWLDESLAFEDVAAIAAVLAGTMLVIHARFRLGPPPSERVGRGLLFGALAGVGQAAGYLLSRAAMREVTPLEASFVRLSTGLGGLLVLGLVTGSLGRWRAAFAGPAVFVKLAGSTIVGAVIGTFLAQYALLHASSTAVASTFLATAPLFALPLGRAIGGEPVTVRAVAATALACVGLVALTLRG